MEKRIKILLMGCAFAGAVSLTSCQTKMHAINQLENFSQELRQHSRYYSVKEWEQAGEDFIQIRKNIAKHEMDYTPEQKQRIGVLEGECAGYMAKGMKDGIFDKVKGFANELNGILQGILNAVTD